ncbi:MAG: hypothetical protein CVU66_01180 [Deltaproteobacteria bacterium HGW-Deltaproteobacteria-23]|jgi:hypothetical protein|nr:MAG: hypothetical protein CVU66_01180 [Deltaproteobacteria bacterium HGW-Deltaproteobacteria-23]
MEVLNNFFQSVGTVKEVYTQVDFYTYIKSVEYMICVAFFIGFPILYRHLHRESDSHETKKVH